MISQERLKEVLYYHPQSGDFIWIAKTSKTARTQVGTQAGTLKVNGYMTIQIDGVLYVSHRLAWFYMTGEWPAEDIDHRDTVRHHNQWDNLREANRSQNGFNKNLYRNSKTKTKNIHWCRRDKRFILQVRVDKKVTRVGSFTSLEAAVAKRDEIIPPLYGEFARIPVA